MMIIEQLYDDDKISDAFLDVCHSEYAADAFSTALDCAKRMRDKYEAERAIQAAEIDRLKGLLDVNRNVSVSVQLYGAELFQEKDAEIERLKAALAQTWQPVDEDNGELPDLRADDDRGIFVHEDGRGIEFYCEGGELDGYFQLPEGYAVCRKVQP